MVAVQGDQDQSTIGTAALGEPAGAENKGCEASVGVGSSRLLPTGMPAAIKVASRGLQRGNTGVSGVGGGFGGARSGGEELEEKRAIVDVFRRVDIDASGRISQEELLEGVSATPTP